VTCSREGTQAAGERYRASACLSATTRRPLDPARCGLVAALVGFETCLVDHCQSLADVARYSAGPWGACSANCTDVSAAEAPHQTRCDAAGARARQRLEFSVAARCLVIAV
jgi:hypothetical protein